MVIIFFKKKDIKRISSSENSMMKRVDDRNRVFSVLWEPVPFMREIERLQWQYLHKDVTVWKMKIFLPLPFSWVKAVPFMRERASGKRKQPRLSKALLYVFLEKQKHVLIHVRRFRLCVTRSIPA